MAVPMYIPTTSAISLIASDWTHNPLLHLVPMSNLLYIILGSLHAALTTYFLFSCYRPGHIFSRYWEWLSAAHSQNKWWALAFAKPLGLCAYCQNVWVSFALTFFYAINALVSWWAVFIVPVAAHYILSYILWQHNANE